MILNIDCFKDTLSYIIEQTDGSMNSYGDLITRVVAESDQKKEEENFLFLIFYYHLPKCIFSSALY